MVKRDFLFVGCEKGCDMKHIGGCNAACHDDCACSVPVHTCSRCGDCDYGDNAEAKQVRADCAAQFGPPSERFDDPNPPADLSDGLPHLNR